MSPYGPAFVLAMFAETFPACISRRQIVNSAPIIRGCDSRYAAIDSCAVVCAMTTYAKTPAQIESI